MYSIGFVQVGIEIIYFLCVKKYINSLYVFNVKQCYVCVIVIPSCAV